MKQPYSTPCESLIEKQVVSGGYTHSYLAFTSFMLFISSNSGYVTVCYPVCSLYMKQKWKYHDVHYISLYELNISALWGLLHRWEDNVRMDLDKHCRRMWTRFTWQGIRTSGRPLWTW